MTILPWDIQNYVLIVPKYKFILLRKTSYQVFWTSSIVTVDIIDIAEDCGKSIASAAELTLACINSLRPSDAYMHR